MLEIWTGRMWILFGRKCRINPARWTPFRFGIGGISGSSEDAHRQRRALRLHFVFPSAFLFVSPSYVPVLSQFLWMFEEAATISTGRRVQYSECLDAFLHRVTRCMSRSRPGRVSLSY